jgi:hypothetical protein
MINYSNIIVLLAHHLTREQQGYHMGYLDWSPAHLKVLPNLV